MQMSLKYARMAESHWRRWRPGQVAQMSDPSSFFLELGNQAANQINNLTFDLAGDDRPDETYMQKLGRLQMARVRAEEMVLPELILVDPEPGMEEDEDSTTGS
jgi:hypothetical protein